MLGRQSVQDFIDRVIWRAALAQHREEIFLFVDDVQGQIKTNEIYKSCNWRRVEVRGVRQRLQGATHAPVV